MTADRRTLAGEAAIALGLFLATLLLRATSFAPAVVDTDEGLYMVQAREWLHGGWPLVAAWDMHPIGAPALFALAFLVWEPGVGAARALGLLCVFATAWALYGCARAAGAGRGVGIAAGTAYAAHSVLLGGLCSNTELLIAPFVAAAMALGMRGAARGLAERPAPPGWLSLCAMGALIGPALVVKQVVVPEGSLAFALLTFPALARGVLPVPRFLAMAAAYAVLCAAPFVLAGVVYWAQGWLEQYLDGSLLAPFRYSLDRIAPGEAWRRVGVAVLQLAWPMALAVLAIGAWRPARAGEGLLAPLALLWFVVATAAIAAPGFYFAHYFLLWLPPLALLAALGLAVAVRLLASPRPRAAFAALTLALTADAWTAELGARLDRGPGLAQPDPVREVATAVRSAIAPGETAFIANYHPTVYVLSGAALPTRFPFPAHLTGFFARIADTESDVELARVLETRPRAIVLDRGWMQTLRPSAAEILDATLDVNGYDLFATVPEQRGPVEIWRARDVTGEETTPSSGP